MKTLRIRDQLLVDLYGCEYPPPDLSEPQEGLWGRYPVKPISPCPECLLLAVWMLGRPASRPIPSYRYVILPLLRELNKLGLVKGTMLPKVGEPCEFLYTLLYTYCLRDGRCIRHAMAPREIIRLAKSYPPPIGLQTLKVSDPTQPMPKLMYMDFLYPEYRLWELTGKGIVAARRLIETGDPMGVDASGISGGAAGIGRTGVAAAPGGGQAPGTATSIEWSVPLPKRKIASVVGVSLGREKERNRFDYRQFNKAYGKRLRRVDGTYLYHVDLTNLHPDIADKLRKHKPPQ